MRTYKFRLFPDKQTQSKLWLHANILNKYYNFFLNQRIESYKTDKTKISRTNQQAQLVDLKDKDPVLNEMHSQVIQQITLRLDNSYKNFFRRIKDSSAHAKGFPKFRSCRNFFGILYPQSGYKIVDNIFSTKVYGNIKFSKHREILGKIKQVQITTENNKWYICITTDYEKEHLDLKESVGIDVGITNLAATSDGKIIKNYNHAKYFNQQINVLKSKRDKLPKKYSRKYNYYTEIIRKLYGVKSRKINDFQHKISYGLSRKYDTIFIEKLDLKKMSEKEITGLNRELRNAKIAQFITFLKYKTNHVIEVNPRNTSKTCCQCGALHNMPLSKRTMNCECGNIIDRDLNAAKNIYCLGQAILSGECSESSEIREAPAFRQG